MYSSIRRSFSPTGGGRKVFQAGGFEFKFMYATTGMKTITSYLEIGPPELYIQQRHIL